MNPSAEQTLLHRVDLAGVYRLPGSDRERMIAAAAACGYRVFVVDLGAVKDKAQLLDALARTLAFPDWFGGNYDGLYDCLCDLSWQPAKGYLLLLDHCPDLGKAAEQDFLTLLTLLDLLGDVAAEWRQRSVAFWSLTDGPADGAAQLPTVADGK